MDPEDLRRISELLGQIRDNQEKQLERQAEALGMQKQQCEIASRQVERAGKLQDRAEELQARGMGIMKTARRSIAIVLPVVILLIAYLSWLLFR